MSLLIHNVTIFRNSPGKKILTNAALAIENDTIVALGSEKDIINKFPSFTRLDGAGRLLMPGLVNAHMHFYSTFARGIAMQGNPKNFSDILEMLWWKLDRILDLDAVYYSALVPAITAVKRGVTSVIDHHASPHAVDGSLDRVEAALSRVGLRASLCYEVSDRDGAGISAAGLAENERYLKNAKPQNPQIQITCMMDSLACTLRLPSRTAHWKKLLPWRHHWKVDATFTPWKMLQISVNPCANTIVA